MHESEGGERGREIGEGERRELLSFHYVRCIKLCKDKIKDFSLKYASRATMSSRRTKWGNARSELRKMQIICIRIHWKIATNSFIWKRRFVRMQFCASKIDEN